MGYGVKKVGILGLGLIGGSILKGLYKLNKYELFAVSKSSYNLAVPYCAVSGADISILADCDIVFVCSKMSETIQKLNELNGVLKDGAIVTDVCSIKSFLPDKKNFKFNFIKSHPMAGTEFSGFENSFDGLFLNAKWIIEEKNSALEEIIKDLGAKPFVTESFEHDKLTSEISHLPTLLSFALFNSASDNSKKIASSGFRDLTRLSMTNSDLAFDMLKFNKENILSAYKKLLASFEELINLDEEEFKKKVSLIAKKRSKMYDKNGKNIL